MTRQAEPIDTAAAINTALQAERDALHAVASAMAEAQRLLEQARSRAQHIVDRADTRIARVHARCGRRVMERVNALRKQEAGLRANKPWSELNQTQVDLVTAQVAAALTGADATSLVEDTSDGSSR
jgi:hypothetical protein